MNSDGKKLAFLTLVNAKKKVLFPALSSTLSAKDKEAAWKSIINDCKSKHGFDPTPKPTPKQTMHAMHTTSQTPPDDSFRGRFWLVCGELHDFFGSL